jgi:hypothetical protein
VALFINEWLAGNVNTLADPADEDFEDWFEIYNAGTNAVDLSGYYLTDTLTNRTKFRIPDGYFVPANGFLLVWADEEAGQNNTNRADLHVNFRLAASGEEIGLYSPVADVIDEVTFGAQTNDISQGRFADGAAAVYFMTTPTPRAANTIGSGNTPPQIAVIGDKFVTLGQTLAFNVTATDSDLPPQSISYALQGVVPMGLAIDMTSGVLMWTPDQSQSPGTNFITVHATDSGSPPLSATRTFNIFVVQPPRVAKIGIAAPGRVALELPAIVGKRYRVEFKNSLSDVNWTPLGADRVANSSMLLIEDDIGANTQRFYRVAILD